MHRYCAGISSHHYQKIIDELVPFVCLPCTQLLHEAELRTLQSEIEQLKSECRELRAELRAKAARDAVQAPPTRAGESAQPSADFHALKKDVEQLQTTVEAQSRSYAAALKAGTSSRVSPKNKTKTSFSKSKGPSKPKVPVDGARKIWGTIERPQLQL